MEKKLVYLDCAATSLYRPPEVQRAVCDAMAHFGNPSRSAHRSVLSAARTVMEAREALAKLFHYPDSSRVIFTKNATEALNIAIHSVEGHIVSSESEHNSVLRPLHHRGGFSLAESQPDGTVTLEAVQRALRPDTRAVVLAHASNVTGNLAPVAEVGALCAQRGLLFIVDAAQSVGLLPIDMQALHIDALCFTGHKSLYGPQGTGGLCLSRQFPAKPLLFGGTGSRSFDATQPPDLPDLLEAGTLNGHGIAGLLAGVQYIAQKELPSLYSGAMQVSNLFYNEIKSIPGIVFYGDYTAKTRAPIVSLNLPGLDSGEVAGILDADYGIAVRAGIHCAPLLHQRLGTQNTGAVRFSFSHFNTLEEANYAAGALKSIADSS